MLQAFFNSPASVFMSSTVESGKNRLKAGDRRQQRVKRGERIREELLSVCPGEEDQ